MLSLLIGLPLKIYNTYLTEGYKTNNFFWFKEINYKLCSEIDDNDLIIRKDTSGCI